MALALVAALVAVPVVLGSGRDSGASGAVLPPERPGATTQVTLEPTAVVRADRPGILRNPFKPRFSIASATSAAGIPAAGDAPVAPAGSSPAAGGGAAASPGGSGGGGATPPSTDASPSTPAPEPAPKPAATPAVSYTTRMRFGPVTAPRPVKDVGRLAPLPSAEQPFLVFLGVLSDKRTAVFLLSKDVTATGGGNCRPRASSCETVELEVGETERFAVTGEDGVVRNYDLDLLRISGSDGYVANPRKSKTVGYELDERSGVLRRMSRPAAADAKTAAVAGVRVDKLTAAALGAWFAASSVAPAP